MSDDFSKKKVARIEQRAQKLASKEAKTDLEKLFSTSKVAKEKVAFIEELKTLRGKSDYYTRLSAYFNEKGVPLEWDLQMLFLDHRDSKIVIQILEQLQKTAPTSDLAQQDFLTKKLNVLEVSTFDSGILEQIHKLKKSLLRA